MRSAVMWVSATLAGAGRYAAVLPHSSDTLWGFNPLPFIFLNRAEWAVCPRNRTSSSQQQHLVAQQPCGDNSPSLIRLEANANGSHSPPPCFFTLYTTTTNTYTHTRIQPPHHEWHHSVWVTNQPSNHRALQATPSSSCSGLVGVFAGLCLCVCCYVWERWYHMEEEQTGCSVKPCPAPVILQSFLLTCHPPVCQQPSQQRQRETDGEETRER